MTVKDSTRPLSSRGKKRLRTYFVVRRRYKRARWVAAATGMVIAALVVGIVLVALEAGGSDLGASLYLVATLLILLATVLSWQLIEAMWHRSRRFNQGP